MDQSQGAATAAPKRQGWTKAKAILAGGLVLGVGAAITLAAWTDQEWASGLFSTGVFGIEGSTDGTDFASHTSKDDAAGLTFSTGVTDLTPDDVVYAPFAVRLDQDATRQADVTISPDASTGIIGATASHVLTSSMTCGANEFTGTPDTGTEFSLATLADVQYVCFRVVAGAEGTLAQGQDGAFAWQFEADSTDPIA